MADSILILDVSASIHLFSHLVFTQHSTGLLLGILIGVLRPLHNRALISHSSVIFIYLYRGLVISLLIGNIRVSGTQTAHRSGHTIL